MSRYDELAKLQTLKDTGAITEEEFAREKQRIFDSPETPLQPSAGAPDGAVKPWGMEVKTYCMLLHFALLAGFVIPVAGFVLPIVMWVLYKDQIAEVDLHGREVINWMISAVIYAAISFVLIFILIGALLLAALGVIGIVFPIIGGVKANEGVLWRYPITMRFL